MRIGAKRALGAADEAVPGVAVVQRLRFGAPVADVVVGLRAE